MYGGSMNAKFAIERERYNKLYYMEYENDQCLPHFHSQIELYFIENGEMDIIVNNNKKTLCKGELALSLSYDTHQYMTNEYSRSSVFIIPAYMCEKLQEVVRGKRVANPFISDPEVVELIKDCIFRINNEKLSELRLLGYIYVILGAIIENIDFEKTQQSIDADLSSKILFYLDSNFHDQISLNDLSGALGYSSYYISRYFKNCFKIGFNQYLTLLRLQKAVTLLSENQKNITYCAFESGFNSMRTFYRAFLKEFGVTPKEYINNLKKEFPSQIY